MYCQYCGQELADNDAYCLKCGKSVNDNKEIALREASAQGKASFGWAVLGFFLPVVGLILYIVWKAEHPSAAKKAGIGALAGVVTEIAVSIISIVISIIATAIPFIVYYAAPGASMLVM